MKKLFVSITFGVTPEELPHVIGQLEKKVQEQASRAPGCICSHPESADQLRDVNGQLCGNMVVSLVDIH